LVKQPKNAMRDPWR